MTDQNQSNGKLVVQTSSPNRMLSEMKKWISKNMRSPFRDDSKWAEIKSEDGENSIVLVSNSKMDSDYIRKNLLEQASNSMVTWHKGKIGSNVLNEGAAPLIREGLAKGKVYELVADPKIVNGIKQGTMRFARTKSGFITAVKNVKDGKFVGSAALRQSPQNLVKLPIIAWQLMHIIASTTELAKINSRLDALQRSFDDIKFRQESTIVGQIIASNSILDEIIKERITTGTFTRDMEIRLNLVDRDIMAIYERNKILIDNFRNEVEFTMSLPGKIGAVQAKTLIDERGDQAINDMKNLAFLGNIMLKVEQLRIQHLMEHNVNFLEGRMEILHDKVNTFRETYANFPSVGRVKEHALKCVKEMGWWQRISSRGVIKDVKNLGNFSEVPENELLTSPTLGGKYVLLNDENGITQTYLLPAQQLENDTEK